VGAPAAELVNASKRYGEVQALRDVSLIIQPGEVVAMLGPNGAGKTTSISLMLGTRKPTSGTARLFGMSPKDLKARSRIGVMLQESGVPGMLRVEEIVDLFRSYYPAPLATAAPARNYFAAPTCFVTSISFTSIKFSTQTPSLLLTLMATLASRPSEKLNGLGCRSGTYIGLLARQMVIIQHTCFANENHPNRQNEARRPKTNRKGVGV